MRTKKQSMERQFTLPLYLYPLQRRTILCRMLNVCWVAVRLFTRDIKVYQIKLKQSTTIVPTLRIKYACCMYWKNLKQLSQFIVMDSWAIPGRLSPPPFRNVSSVFSLLSVFCLYHSPEASFS